MNILSNLFGRILFSVLPFLILAFTACKDETVEKEQKIEETIIKEPEVGVLPEIDSSLAFIEIPDTSLQKFLIKAGIDSDLRVNGRVYLKDVEKIDSLNINLISENNNYVRYHTLSGLEQFPNLKKLEMIQLIDSVDLSQFKKLTHFKFNLIYNNNQMEFFKTTGADDLKEIIFGTEYTRNQAYYFTISEIKLPEIDLTKNKKLEKLVLYGMKNLKNLDLKQNEALKSLSLIVVREMEKLDLTYNTSLEKLVIIDSDKINTICLNKNVEIQGSNQANYLLRGIDLYLESNNSENFSFTHCK